MLIGTCHGSVLPTRADVDACFMRTIQYGVLLAGTAHTVVTNAVFAIFRPECRTADADWVLVTSHTTNDLGCNVVKTVCADQLVLVLVPNLYCSVGDVWLQPN